MKFLMQLTKTDYNCDVYPQVTVYQETNNFGDQFLTFRKESISGEVTTYYATFDEGQWVTSKRGLLNVYNRVSKRDL